MPTLCLGLCTQEIGSSGRGGDCEQKPSTVWKWEEPSRNAHSQTPAKASLVGRPTGLTMPRNFPKQGGTSTADQAKVQAEKQQGAQWLG